MHTLRGNRLPRPLRGGIRLSGVVAGMCLVLLSCRSGPTDPGVREPAVVSISLEPAAFVLAAGETLDLRATATDSSGRILEDVGLAWESSDTLAAIVTAAGRVTGIGAGRAVVRVRAGTQEALADARVVGVNPVKPRQGAMTLWMLPNRWTELFADPPGWAGIRERLQVAKVYSYWFDDLPDETLADAVRTLNENHIAIAMEVGGLREWNCSGADISRWDLANLARLDAAGGVVTMLTMDDPFGTTMERANPTNGCGYSALRVSQELVEFIRPIRAKYPWVQLGLIEPVPWFHVGEYANHPGNDFGDLPALLDTLQAVLSAAGERLLFFHADSPYDWTEAHPAKWAKLVSLERAVHERGLGFGMIYNSEVGGTTSDEAYHAQTLAALQAHWDAGGRPDHLVVQSWYPLPSRMSPEDQPYTFSNVMKDFIALFDVLRGG